MNIQIRESTAADLSALIDIWNQVVRAGEAFPQEEYLTIETGRSFFASQSYTAVAEDLESHSVLGLYILHPNNIGRCGHIANASFAVHYRSHGLHIGESLVTHCLKTAKNLGFRILQFNAVVDSNIHAQHLYKRLGFTDLGIIPQGFRMPDGHYEDIHVMYHTL
ncbi:MAG: GNAT family N-acetyltransferase [Clostridia bacterium]|nr:GNAT family N-acetyltransferase [Clostridia bacterium]